MPDQDARKELQPAQALTSDTETPPATDQSATDSSDIGYAGDSFAHVNEQDIEYTDYNRRGRYVSDGTRTLPRRYYDGSLRADVYYDDKTLTQLEFLELAVLRSGFVLDERRTVLENEQAAEKKLIFDTAKPLYPWSTTLYSQDAQLRFETSSGSVTGWLRAFYMTADGRKMTVRYLAEQLAFGIPPDKLDGDYGFLRDLDAELCAKATMLGNAARRFRGIDAAYQAETITEDQYLEDIRLYVIYYLGYNEGHKSAQQLRDILADTQFAKKALNGMLRAAAPSAVYRRPLTKQGLEAWRKDNQVSLSDVADALEQDE